MSSPDLPLGRQVDYPAHYDPSLLFPIPRRQGRAALGLGEGPLPFTGHDRWHAYELGWLDGRGKPVVATATFVVPADSPSLVESKSLKLYLNSFNGTRFPGPEAVRAQIAADLSAVAAAPVPVEFGLPGFDVAPAGDCIDDLDIDIAHYGPPDSSFLSADPAEIVEETLTSALLKSNCPVTGQPDWGRVSIAYRGPRVDREGLLRYLVSFRDHCEFHEQCVERIFIDLARIAAPEWLSVEARYTRRGGLDINPWRGTPGSLPPGPGRDLRQ